MGAASDTRPRVQSPKLARLELELAEAYEFIRMVTTELNGYYYGIGRGRIGEEFVPVVKRANARRNV